MNSSAHCCNEFIRSTSLFTTLIYPRHSAGGTVWAFVGVRPPCYCQGSFPPTTMPPADFSHAVGADYSNPQPIPLARDGPGQHGRSPGVSTGYFQRTIVRYTWLGHMTDIGLRPVLRTRPGSAPPQICLPSTLSDTGHTCTSTHAFASGFLQACIAATTLALGYRCRSLWSLSPRGSPLRFASSRLRRAGSELCPIFVS